MSAFHVGAVAALFYFSWTAVALTAFFYWVSIGLGHRHGLSPAAHAPVVQGAEAAGILLRHLRHADARGRTDLLGRHAPHPPPALRHRQRPAHAASRRLLGAHGMDPLRRGAPQRHRADVAAMRPTWPPIRSIAGSTPGTGCRSPSSASPCSRSAAGRWCSGWCSSASPSGLHATWLVNSATHMWGSRRFQTKDDSKNSWWVAILTFGEGWHNNHHAHPTSARHGLAWYEVDLTWLQIKCAQLPRHRRSRPRRGCQRPPARPSPPRGVDASSCTSSRALARARPSAVLLAQAKLGHYVRRLRVLWHPSRMISAPKRKSLVFATLGTCLIAWSSR